ncbi:hypothetical protein BGZ82_005442, partial [Podila clonocystis]
KSILLKRSSSMRSSMSNAHLSSSKKKRTLPSPKSLPSFPTRMTLPFPSLHSATGSWLSFSPCSSPSSTSSCT